MLTPEQLQAIMPRCPPEQLNGINAALVDADAEAPIRACAFLAQWALECNQGRNMVEIWNPTRVPAQLNYEPPHLTAAHLGNDQPGDGFRYRGRGACQLTGKSNYRRLSQEPWAIALGLDFVTTPDLVAMPAYAWRAAAAYWRWHNLNAMADQTGDGSPASVAAFQALTKAINGGLTNLTEREAFWHGAQVVLLHTPQS